MSVRGRRVPIRHWRIICCGTSIPANDRRPIRRAERRSALQPPLRSNQRQWRQCHYQEAGRSLSPCWRNRTALWRQNAGFPASYGSKPDRGGSVVVAEQILPTAILVIAVVAVGAML